MEITLSLMNTDMETKITDDDEIIKAKAAALNRGNVVVNGPNFTKSQANNMNSIRLGK